jgi:hypothetical protein
VTWTPQADRLLICSEKRRSDWASTISTTAGVREVEGLGAGQFPQAAAGQALQHEDPAQSWRAFLGRERSLARARQFGDEAALRAAHPL